MSCVIIIRDYKPSDIHFLTQVIRNAYLTNVFSTWLNTLTREITFQLIVMSAAILYIFIGVPLYYCVISIPLVLVIAYIVIYSSFLLKAAELIHSKRPLHCWVAEAYEPVLLLEGPERVSYRILNETQATNEKYSQNYKRKVIGSVAIAKHLHADNAVWIFRLGVTTRYQHKGVAHALIHAAQNWSRHRRYDFMELAVSECQDAARQLFIDTGFEIKQLYHKQLVGNALTLLMYHLMCDLSSLRMQL